MIRRHFLAAIPAVALVACSQQQAAAIPQYVTDAQLIEKGISSVLASLPPSPQLAKLQADLATLQADTTLIANTQPSTSVVRQWASLVSTMAPAMLALIPNGSVLMPIVQAAASLAPVVLAALGVAAAPAAGVVYGAAQARVVLEGVR